MKAPLPTTTYLVVLLCATTSAFAQSSHFDIALEGPWILYRDTQFKNNGSPVAVYIAIAPSVGNFPKPFNHHAPIFTMGDGYPIDVGISCVAFDDGSGNPSCAPNRGVQGPAPNVYPPPHPLPVSVPNGWSWYANSVRDGTYLIIPMPDSISNDGLWYMRFSPKFDATGASYGNIPAGPIFSIGLHLHYNSGPNNLYLMKCTFPDPSPDATHCGSASRPLANSGTLRISMKAPDTDDPCDPHVRFAYQQMLLLLDPTDLNPSTQPHPNTNQNMAYIDLARQVDPTLGTPVYTDPPPPNDCFTGDPQKPLTSGPNSSARHAMTGGHQKPTRPGPKTSPGHPMITIDTITSQLDNILHRLEQVQLTADKRKQDVLLLPEIQAQAKALRTNAPFPRLSEISWLGRLLRLSAAQAEKMSKSESSQRSLLDGIAKSETQLADALPTKSGNDCRAAIMLVGP